MKKLDLMISNKDLSNANINTNANPGLVKSKTDSNDHYNNVGIYSSTNNLHYNSNQRFN